MIEANERSRIPSSNVTSAGSDIPDQIRKLTKLRDAGILSSEELEAKKRELLDRT